MRILLVNPPSPEQLGSPLLGQQYVAAALVRAGHEVRVVDAAARWFDRTDPAATVLDAVSAFDPHVVGIGLFTRWVRHAYELSASLAGKVPLLVAGGAHVTARPFEPLDHGFDATLSGEAEVGVVALLDAWAAGTPLANVPGVHVRDTTGAIVSGPPAGFVDDLDALAPPLVAQHLYDPGWYQSDAPSATPGGILTSRGCPARCTFCANYVTGRGFRYRSAACVVDELNAYHALTGATFFPFWDDALTANRPRLLALCEALARDVEFPLAWSAITRANMVTPEVLEAMRSAGCVHVNFGVESGDDEILRIIKKGLRTDQVTRALGWAKDLGFGTAANFMVGFPEETPRHLANTLAFLEEIAPLVDSFSTLGVLVPFPATPIYEEHHSGFGFTDWWLDERYDRYEPSPPITDRDRFHRHYIDDTNLELDFFDYDDATVAAMREVLRFKAEHNLAAMGLLPDPVFHPQP